MVALFHLGAQWPHVMVPKDVFPRYPDVSAYNPLFYVGFVGVQIFFVISGLVIAASCHGRTPKSFFVGRALRILPLLWTIALIACGIHLYFGAPLVPTAIATVKEMLIWPHGGWLDTVVWTLVPECVFYALVWGCMMSRADLNTSLRYLSIALLCISAAFNSYCLNTGYVGSFLPTVLLLRHGAFFALGIAIWARSAGVPRFTLIQFLALPVCVAEIYLRTRQFGLEVAPEARLSFIGPAAIWAIGLVVILIGSRMTTDRRIPWIRAAGLVTFPIYLAHKNVGGLIVMICTDFGLPVEIAVLTAIAGVCLLCWLLVSKVEPLLKPYFRSGLEMLANRIDFSRVLRIRPSA